VESVGTRFGSGVYQYRAFLLDLVNMREARELILKRGDELAKIGQRPSEGYRAANFVGQTLHLTLVAFWNVIRPAHCARVSLRAHLKRAHEIQAKAGEIDQVVSVERLSVEMRVDQAKRPKAPMGRTKASDVRQHEPSRASNEHPFDRARTMYERADLSVGFF
jgi:hypothetical protein